MESYRLPPRLTLDEHKFLSDNISSYIIGVNLNLIKYNHQQTLTVLNMISNVIKDRYPEISKLIFLAKKYKKRVKNNILSKILSLLDDDYCRVDDEIFNQHRFIYY